MENGPQNSLSWKRQEICKSCQNTGNLEILSQKQQILSAQVVSSLILKIQDIAIFAAKCFSLISYHYETVSNFGKLTQGKFPIGQENTGNL